MFCDGAGVVVLKRLADALADGDTIYSVIRGTGKNNNGARPASFLAPSVDGQAEAVAMAQANANVPIESIRYIEAHGTGTPVGDPIEFEALRKVFESKTSKKQFCYIGSIKGNIGHSTNAAGVVGLIKASLVLHHEEIPPTLHFKSPNAKIDFVNSPFMMADQAHSIPARRGSASRRGQFFWLWRHQRSRHFGRGSGTNASQRDASTAASAALGQEPIGARCVQPFDIEIILQVRRRKALPMQPTRCKPDASRWRTGDLLSPRDFEDAGKLLTQPNPSALR